MSLRRTVTTGNLYAGNRNKEADMNMAKHHMLAGLGLLAVVRL